MNLDVLSEFWVWELLGRLHPLVVHFPIGVLITAFGLELLTLGDKRSELRAGIRWLVFIGAGTSLIAAVVGLIHAYGGNFPASTLAYHKWAGMTTVMLALVAAWLVNRADRSGRKKDLTLYRSIFGINVLLLAFVGHLGASLTHGSDYLTSVLPWNQEAPSKAESVTLLTALVEHSKIGTLEEIHLSQLSTGVRRIFAFSCYRCHASDEAEGGLALDSREAVMAGGESGPIVIPGRPGDSELMRRLLLPQGHEEVMPQKGKSLSSVEVELIRLWIELDAYWSDEEVTVFREAELALSRPELPNATPGLDNPIDRFVDAYFETKGIRWPDPVGDVDFIRRIHMDVIGLLPSPEAVQTFVEDTSPDKRNRLIDSLLSREHDYAQHWLSFWNDLLRNDYSGTGFLGRGRKQITNWLYYALHDNKPYNEMVRELVNPVEGSEGFIEGIKWRGDINASQRTEMQAAQNVSQALLGLNLKCASCHNSFTSNLTLNQAYSFAAVFADSLLEIERCDVPTGSLAEPDFIYKELGDIDGKLSRNERLDQLADLLTDVNNGRLYRTIANRFWARLMGRGLVEPTDAMDLEPWNQDLLDWLAADLIDHDYDLKHLLSSILRSRTYQLPSTGVKAPTRSTDDFVFTGPFRRRLTAEQFADAVGQLASPVYHAVAYDPFDNLAGAEWIWYDARQDERLSLPMPGMYYFRHTFDLPPGRDLAKARLLISVDQAFQLYLNGTLIGEGRDWRQVQNIDVIGQMRTDQNVLAVKGENGGTVPNPAGLLLNLKITFAGGGELEVRSSSQWRVMNLSPQPGWETSSFDDNDWEFVRVYGNSAGSRYWGRLVAFTHEEAGERLQFARASLVQNDQFLAALGRPARDIVITNRNSEATLLQALKLTNGEALDDVLARGADRWMNAYAHDPDEMIRSIYLNAFGRVPNQREAQIAGDLLTSRPDREAVQDLLWVIVMQPEFQFIY